MMTFKNLEYISIENQTTSFPKHFHETFCISLIHKGVEQIDFENQSLFSEAGTISITNPFEVHSNPLINSSSYLKFDTIYIPNEIMQFVLNGKTIKFINRKIENKKANRLFIKLKNAIDSKIVERIETTLLQFVNCLKDYSQENEHDFYELNLDDFKPINSYIENHICEKFNLDELSQLANINKFGFTKKFKFAAGMTPMNYILMKKVFSSKSLITSDAQLTEIAYQYNFTDMAHYSKTFKRFIGISPKKYQDSLL